jgi:predicted nucleic acid-binding protein
MGVNAPVLYLVDTNVLLRFLRNDHPGMSHASRELFEAARNGRVKLDIPLIAIAECFHTLRSFYKIERVAAATEVIKIINSPGVRLSGPSWLRDAVEFYATNSVSFGDACIAAEARSEGKIIASFDRDFDSFPGISRYEPKVSL